VADFTVPELGENVAGGDVTRILVNVGDTIARDQPVLELETDKATIEVPSSVAGVVKSIAVKKGDKIKVGAVVLSVDDSTAKASASAPGASASALGATADKTADTAAAGNGSKAAKAPAETKPEPKPTASQTPPPRQEPEARSEEPAKADPKVVPMPPRSAAGAGQGQSAPEPPAPAAVQAPVARPDGLAAPASPGVRRLAREIGVDINQVQGSGPSGRISLDDVKEQARRILSSIPSTMLGAGGSAGAAAPAGARASRPLPDFSKWGEVDRQPWSNIRRVTAEHLSYAWTTIPHVTQFDKADVTALEELRKKYKEQVAKAGGGLTVTAMLVRILATAVRTFPQFNASIDGDRGELVYKKYVNIGVAVDTDRGLLVPVIRNADQKNIQQIAIEINALAAKARDRKLTLDEMSGGGMTISNLGGIGGTYFTPIVNWPEVAILGVSRGAIEPVWRKGSEAPSGVEGFVPRMMLPLSLSYDHRVIDGADAMRFLRWVVEAIEQPFLLSLIG
jgi:pyruvate dehydrogenase E2 component (dihydrolipoamide acetyltransferase)